MRNIVTLVGRPTSSEKSSALLNHVHALLRRRGIRADAIVADFLPEEDLYLGRAESPAIQSACFALDQAQGIIIVTPICKTSCSAALKAFLALLPQGAFESKTVLPVATSGDPACFAAFDASLEPVFSGLNPQHVIRSVCITNNQIQFEHGGGLHLEDNMDYRLQNSLAELADYAASH